jgi:thioredoxin
LFNFAKTINKYMQKFLFATVILSAVFLMSCSNSQQTDEKTDVKTEKDSFIKTGTSETPKIDTPTKKADAVKPKTEVEKPAVKSNDKPATGVVVHISEEEFCKYVFDFKKGKTWKYKGDMPCIVDFYADWCGPCKRIGPFIEEVAKANKGKLYVFKVNTDNAKDLSRFFNINSIPDVMFCAKKGDPEHLIGAYDKETYLRKAKDIIR